MSALRLLRPSALEDSVPSGHWVVVARELAQSRTAPVFSSVRWVGGGAEPHAHAAEDQILFVIEGTLVLNCAGETLHASAGEDVFVPAAAQCGMRNGAEG